MKNKTLMKIIASALAVCVAAGTVPTTAWAAEDSLSGSSGYAGTPEPGEKPSSGVTPGSRVLSDGFSDEEYTEGVYNEDEYGIDVSDVAVKTKYTVGSGHIYYAPAGEEGGSAFLRLENVPVLGEGDRMLRIAYTLQTPLIVEAVGSNTVDLSAENSAVTLTGNGCFDEAIFEVDAMDKEDFTGELNAIVMRMSEREGEPNLDYTVYGNYVLSGGIMDIGSLQDITITLTISEGASLTVQENFKLRISGNSGDGYSSFLNIEGSLINNGTIIFFRAEPEDPSAFVESFGFSGTGMVMVTSAANLGDINEQNSKVYDNNGFLDMTNVNGETNKMVEIGTDTPKSFYRVGSEGRLYYTPPAGGSKALLKACGIIIYGCDIVCDSEELPVTLCLEGDNYFNVVWSSDITLDGTGSFAGDIQTAGEFSIAESFGGGLNARIAQQIIEASGNDVSVTVNTIVYGDYIQADDAIDIAGYKNVSDGETTYRIQAALTVPEGSSYMIPDGQSAVFSNIGNDYENYLKIDGKIINNGTIVCPGEVPGDRTAFIRSLNLSGSGLVEIMHENDDGTPVIDQYTNDGIKMAYQEGDLDFESNTGDDVRGDHMDEYGYRFEEKDGCYVLTLKDFTTPSGVVIPGDKPVIINSTGVCVIGELCISEKNTSEVTLTFGGDGLLTVNKNIRISKKSVITIDENAKITVNNGFDAGPDGEGRLIVNGALTAMCDETRSSSDAVYAGALEIGSAGILNVTGSRGVWIVRASDTEPGDYSLEIKEGGQLIADCSGHGFVIDNRCNGHLEDEVISIPAGYFPHGYGFIEASEQYEYPCTPLVLALEGSRITVDVYGRCLTGSKGAEGYIAIHSHSADYDKYIPDPDHAGRHIKYCSNGSGHSDSAEACTFGDWVQTVAPTETSTGVKTRTCSVCGGTEEEIIPKLISVSLKTGTDVSLKNNVLTYGEPLSKLVFNEAEFVDSDGNTVAGALAWKDAAAAPDAGTAGAAWVFTPAESKYASLEGVAAITVNKAVPTISTAPAVTGRVYDPSMTLKDDDLSGGIVTGVDGGSLGGTWSWQDRDIVPAVGNSGYEAVFTPEDAKNYETVTGTVSVDVTKAQNAPNIPDNSINVLNTVKKAGSVTLPEGWEWQEADKEKALVAGASVEAVAVYTGGDKGNYEKETVTIAISRSACDDASGEILYTGEGEKAPACTEDGLGHKECSLCGDVTESGIVVKATGHDWHLTSEEAATTTSEGKRVYTCSVCSRTREETIPKLPPVPTGTPGQTEKPLETGVPGQTEKPLATGVPGQTEKPLATGAPVQTPTEEPVQTGAPLQVPTGTPGQTGTPALTPTGTPEQPAKQPQDKAEPENVKETSAQLDSGISVKWKGNALALKWKKTEGADGYDVFAAPGGKKPDKKSPVKTVKNGKTSVSLTKIDGKKLSGKKVYSVKIKAWKYVDGKKTYTGESRTYHIAGKDNKKYTNVKKLKPGKKKYTLKKGKSARLQVTVSKEAAKKKLLPKSYGPALRYWSGNEKIATVTQGGRVKAGKKGSCYIYATALNGVSTRIKITVK